MQVRDFGKSWSSGTAIVALIKSINPNLVDLNQSLSSDPRGNIQLALEIAHRCLDIPPLLESEGAWNRFNSNDTENEMKICLLVEKHK